MTEARRQKIDQVLSLRQPDLTVLMERVHKPHNFAAVIRSCDAVGVTRIHAVPASGGLPALNHTSQGAQKWVEVQRHHSSELAVQHLKEQGFQLAAAHFSKRAVDFREHDYTQPTAVILGTERFGVTEDVLRKCDMEIKIPMLGMTQSLNVSVACAVILYEAQRQRQAAGLYAERSLPASDRQRLRFEWIHPKIAEYCRDHDLPYPQLDDAGEPIEPLPHS